MTNKNSTQTNQKTIDINSNTNNTNKIIAVALSIAGIAGIITFATQALPYLAQQSDEQVAFREERERELREKQVKEGLIETIKQENEKLGFNTNFTENTPNDQFGVYENMDRKVKMQTNFGDINIDLYPEAAPKTVENFVRLVDRDYYDNTLIHRIVKQENFNVIQGGDKENRDGTGGRSAFYISEENPNQFEDEIWEVAPEFGVNPESGDTTLFNDPVFASNDLYKDFDKDTGQSIYPKGTIIMANSGPNTNGSQFFITLTDTILSPNYTAFGKVEESSIAVIDRIQNEVEPGLTLNQINSGITEESAGPINDGYPKTKIEIQQVENI